MAHIMISFYNLCRAKSLATIDLSRPFRDVLVSRDLKILNDLKLNCRKCILYN